MKSVANTKRQLTDLIQLGSHHSAIIDSSADAIISKNAEGIILSWNRGAERLYGYTAKEAIGQPITLLIPSEYGNDFPRIMDRLLKGKKVQNYETKRRTKDGRILDVSLTISPLKDASGKIVGASKIARDITKQKKLEQQRDDFISIATHELKTPVTSIKAYTQVLKSVFAKQADKRAVEYLDKMDAQLNKLTSLISDLLDVNKIQNDHLFFEKEPFNLNGLIVEIVEELQRTTDRHNLVMELARSIEIVGDRDRLGQVLTNLISNAIKYSPHGGEIIVKTQVKPDQAVVSVQDFGVGIPEDKLASVFEKFFRVSGPKQDTFPGMGLGLYISAEIVKRQGGQIWVESQEGKGSTFYFSLPIVAN